MSLYFFFHVCLIIPPNLDSTKAKKHIVRNEEFIRSRIRMREKDSFQVTKPPRSNAFIRAGENAARALSPCDLSRK